MATLTVPPIEQLFQGLADRTRLRLLNLMADQEVCVCYFVEILGLSQPVISRHLAYLRARGLVTSRRQGKWMHYRIAPQATPLSLIHISSASPALSTTPSNSSGSFTMAGGTDTSSCTRPPRPLSSTPTRRSNSVPTTATGGSTSAPRPHPCPLAQSWLVPSPEPTTPAPLLHFSSC